MFVSYKISVKMKNKSKEALWNSSKSILQGIFIGFKSDQCIALSLSHFLLFLNFTLIVGFIKVVGWLLKVFVNIDKERRKIYYMLNVYI